MFTFLGRGHSENTCSRSSQRAQKPVVAAVKIIDQSIVKSVQFSSIQLENKQQKMNKKVTAEPISSARELQHQFTKARLNRRGCERLIVSTLQRNDVINDRLAEKIPTLICPNYEKTAIYIFLQAEIDDQMAVAINVNKSINDGDTWRNNTVEQKRSQPLHHKITLYRNAKHPDRLRASYDFTMPKLPLAHPYKRHYIIVVYWSIQQSYPIPANIFVQLDSAVWNRKTVQDSHQPMAYEAQKHYQLGETTSTSTITVMPGEVYVIKGCVLSEDVAINDNPLLKIWTYPCWTADLSILHITLAYVWDGIVWDKDWTIASRSIEETLLRCGKNYKLTGTLTYTPVEEQIRQLKKRVARNAKRN